MPRPISLALKNPAKIFRRAGALRSYTGIRRYGARRTYRPTYRRKYYRRRY